MVQSTVRVERLFITLWSSEKACYAVERLEGIERETETEIGRAKTAIREDVETATEPRPAEGGLVTLRGGRPLRLRYVVEPQSGDVVQVLPQSEAQRRGGRPR